MTTYVEKPLEYEVKQWDGTIEGAREVAEFVDGTEAVSQVHIAGEHALLYLEGGGRQILKGHWVLKSADGRIHIVSDERFQERYWQVPE